uniref:TM2 domain-containing protein n=1 Tax=Parastrongyloides trichosuri TaxID=131310 RepID=A0A0N5A1G3_PARTI
MVDVVDGNEKIASLFKTRLLLTLGGIFGAHRIYLKQYPEAFIYLTTFGGFLFTVFYDTINLHEMVENYNNKLINKENNENERFYNAPRRFFSIIPWNSVTFLIAQVSYGVWMGALFLTLKTMFLYDDELHISTAFIVALGTSFGIYVMGNTGSERRSLLPIWCASFAVAFLLFCIIEVSYFKTLIFIAISGAAMGNKAKLKEELTNRNVEDNSMKEFTFKHFIIWSCLFGILILSLYVGISETILDRRIRVGSSPGSRTIRNLIFNYGSGKEIDNHKFFLSSADVSYLEPFKRNLKIYSLFKARDNDWTASMSSFIVDVARAHSYQIYLIKTKKFEENSFRHPIFWAFNRIFVLRNFDQKPFVRDMVLKNLCEKANKDYAKTMKNNFSKLDPFDKKDYKSLNTKKCCDIYTSLLKVIDGVKV